MIEFLKKNKEDVFFYCIVLSIVTLPFSVKINSIAIMLLVLCWLLKDSIKEKISNIQPKLFFLFISVYVIHLIGMFYTSNISQGIFEIEKKLSLLVFPVVLGTTHRFKKEQVQKVLNYFAAVCITASVLCLLYAVYKTISSGSFHYLNPQTQYTTYYFFYDGLSELFMHPVYFSVYIVFSFFIIFKNTIDNWQTVSCRRNLIKTILLFHCVIFLMLLSSRMMIIIFLVAVVSYITFLFFKHEKKWLGISVSMLAALMLASAVIFIPYVRTRMSELVTSSYHFENNPKTNSNLSGKLDGVEMRLAKWYFTVEAGKQSPLFGTGTGDDEDALLDTYKKNNFREGYIPQFNSHNQFLQTWLGLGAVGLLLLVLNLFIPLFLAFKEHNFYYFIFLILIISFCFTESILCRQHGVVFYSFFNSLFAFHSLKTNPH